jgi:hypothetical protein
MQELTEPTRLGLRLRSNRTGRRCIPAELTAFTRPDETRTRRADSRSGRHVPSARACPGAGEMCDTAQRRRCTVAAGVALAHSALSSLRGRLERIGADADSVDFRRGTDSQPHKQP